MYVSLGYNRRRVEFVLKNSKAHELSKRAGRVRSIFLLRDASSNIDIDLMTALKCTRIVRFAKFLCICLLNFSSSISIDLLLLHKFSQRRK